MATYSSKPATAHLTQIFQLMSWEVHMRIFCEHQQTLIRDASQLEGRYAKSKNIPNIQKHPQNSKCQKSDIHQVLHGGPPNTSGHGTKFSHLGFVHTYICHQQLLVLNCKEYCFMLGNFWISMYHKQHVNTKEKFTKTFK